MLYLSSSLPPLLNISSIFRSNKTVPPTNNLPVLGDTLATSPSGRQGPHSAQSVGRSAFVQGHSAAAFH